MNKEIPTLPVSSDNVVFFKVFATLFLMILLILILAYFYRKFMGITFNPQSKNSLKIRILANTALGDKKFLSVALVKNRCFLLGISSENINCLAELDFDPQEDLEVSKDEHHSFESFIKKAFKKGEDTK